MRARGKLRFKYRARLRKRRKRKAARVVGVSIDQFVACPSCGRPMQLSELWTFKCTECSQEFTAEEAIKILETARA